MLKGKISDFFTLRFGKALRSIAYPDINLGQNLANIEKIIERGYPVLVNINHGYLDPTFLRTIYFYEPLLKLIKRTDADIYFLNPREARQLKYSSIESAAPISIAIEKKENLFQDLPTNNDELLLKRVANFFGFMHYKILD